MLPTSVWAPRALSWPRQELASVITELGLLINSMEGLVQLLISLLFDFIACSSRATFEPRDEVVLEILHEECDNYIGDVHGIARLLWESKRAPIARTLTPEHCVTIS